MATVAELIHTDRPRGYWRFEEQAGSTVIRDSSGSNMHGTPVNGPLVGQMGLVPGSQRSLGVYGYPNNGAHVEVPYNTLMDVSNITFGMWLRAKRSFNQYGPGLYFRLDELDTNIINYGSWGAGSDGDYVGGPGTVPHLNQVGAVPGVTGASMLLQAADGNYITVPDSANLRLNAGAFTVAFFFRLKSGGTANQTFFAKDDWTTANGYGLFQDQFGVMTFKRNNVNKSFGLSGTDVIKFYHIAITYNGTQLKWYINGTLRQTDSVAAYPTNAGTAPFRIGDGFDLIDGWFDDFLIYNVALPDNEILNAAQGYPPNSIPITDWFFAGRPSRWELTWTSWQRSFNFRPWLSGAPNNTWTFDYNVQRGERYFVAGTYDGANARLYVNGVQIGSVASSAPLATGSSPLRFGRVYGGPDGDWDIDDAFLFDYALSAARIAEYHTASVTGAVPVCVVPNGKAHERIIYIRPDAAGARKYLLHAPPSRVMLSEEGFGTPPLEYVTDRAPFQHGDRVRSFHLNPRQVQLVTLQNFNSRAAYQDGRQALLEILRPNALAGPLSDPAQQGKLLCYLANGQKRQLDVLLDSGPGFAPPQGGWREWSFTEVLRFTAHEPTWYNPTRKEITLAASGVGGFTFPVEFPITFESLDYGGGEASAIVYLGDWPSYPVITIYGPITSPSVTNQSIGHSIALATTIPEGYAAIIDLTPGVKSVVRSDGLSLLGFVSDDSDLTDFALYPDPTVPGGVNSIIVTGTATEAGTPEPTVSYYDRYIGI